MEERVSVSSEQVAEERVAAAGGAENEALETPSPLRGTPPSQGESFKGSEGMENDARKTPSSLRGTPPSQGESLTHESSASAGSVQVRTQGVRVSRAEMTRHRLRAAAESAARTGHRTDVHAYMRVRRNYV